MVQFWNVNDPHGLESGFMSKETNKKEIEAELAAFRKTFENMKSPWEQYDISKESETLTANYETPRLDMTISALQKSQTMYEEEENRQRAKQQAKYGVGSDMHRFKYDVYKQMQKRKVSNGYKDLQSLSRLQNNPSIYSQRSMISRLDSE